MKSIPLLIAFIFISVVTGTATDIREMQTGKWTIRYDLDSGLADFLYQDTLVLKNTRAAGSQDCRNLLITQKGKLTSSGWQNALGNGMQYVVSHDEAGGTIRRIFYLYADSDYFITEAVVDGGGKKNVSYRNITVLDGEIPETALDGDEQRMLSIPFDNDKWGRYNTLPLSHDNVSHEVSAIYDNVSRRGLIIGSIDHDLWKSAVVYKKNETGRNLRFISGYTSSDTRDLLPHGAVKDKIIHSSRVLIGMYEDWRNGMENYGSIHATLHGKRNWTKKKPVGWNSWGKMKFDITISKLTETSDYIATNLQPVGFETADSIFYVDIDSGWNQLDEAGLAAFVKHCETNGQIAGAYFAPYGHWGDNHNVAISEMPQYKFSDAGLYANGQYLLTVADALALDPTHPAIKKRIDNRIDLIKRLGFKYLKIDFMTQAALEADRWYDPAIHTGMQAYNYALKYLTDKIDDDDMYITMAISPLFPTQYVHSRRISCDAWTSIEDTEYTLNGTTYGWWLSKAYCYNDPDHIVLEGGSDEANRSRITSGIVTGIIILGDDFSLSGSSTAKRKAMDFLTNPDINRLIKTESAFRPVEGRSTEASNMFTCQDASGFYLALINYSRVQDLDFTLDFNRIGLDPQAQYSVKELWSGNAFQASNNVRLTLTTRNAAIYQFIKR